MKGAPFYVMSPDLQGSERVLLAGYAFLPLETMLRESLHKDALQDACRPTPLRAVFKYAQESFEERI